MPKDDWVKNPVHKILRDAGLWPFKNVRNVLDVACGLSLKSKFLKPDFILGVDIHRPYLEAIEYDGNYAALTYDVTRIDELFGPGSFEVVYILDIIEHLEKEDALHLIEICKRICSRGVVLETPEGYVPQNLDILGFDAHHLQTHRCGWEVEELEQLGFNCVTRSYTMANIKRHTDLDVDVNINLIDGIYVK